MSHIGIRRKSKCRFDHRQVYTHTLVEEGPPMVASIIGRYAYIQEEQSPFRSQGVNNIAEGQDNRRWFRSLGGRVFRARVRGWKIPGSFGGFTTAEPSGVLASKVKPRDVWVFLYCCSRCAHDSVLASSVVASFKAATTLTKNRQKSLDAPGKRNKTLFL